MLSAPAPFPQVGSYALFQEEERLHLVRIQGHASVFEVLISFPLRPDVASGTRTVLLETLLDGTPLTAAERQRLETLERQVIPVLAAGGAAVKKRRAEADALRAQDVNASRLTRFLERLPDKSKRGSAPERSA